MVLAMSEEQVKAVETEATAQEESAVEEISEEDLEGVAGGAESSLPGNDWGFAYSDSP